ncbi:hypothetical protein, partial [Photobacterium leiognathi]
KVNKDGYTALHAAEHQGYQECVTALHAAMQRNIRGSRANEW